MADTVAWREFLSFASRQHNVVRTSDGARFGIAASTLRDRARREGWGKPQRGIVMLPGGVASFPARCMAAHLAAGEGSLISRWSALYLHGLIDTVPTHVDLVVPGHRRPPRLHRVRSWRSRTLGENDSTAVRGIPTTTVGRTLIDLAAVATPRYLRGRTIAAVQRGLIAPERLKTRVDELRSFRGRAKLTRVLDDLGRERTDSLFERDVRMFLRRGGITGIHPGPFPYRCPDGVLIHIDIALPPWWIAVECDHPFTHGPEVFETDRVRWSQMMAGGWSLVFVTPERLSDHPGGILTEIEQHIERADPSRAPPPCAT